MPLLAHATYNIVQIQRIDQDVYQDQTSGVFIKTQFCYSYHFGEAVLKITGPEGPSMGYLWFGDSTVCRVVGLYKQRPSPT